jgi:tetratricopeptide (TPR) repeat protein
MAMFDMRRLKSDVRVLGSLLLLVALLSGCQHDARMSPHAKMRVGMFDQARDLVESQVVDDRGDRRYMLDRMRAGVLNLDAGDPARAERWFAEVYDVLRTQGLNEDKTVSSVVLTEGVKVWKGEPFEQAMALVYYGFVQASLGSWDNARAAAGNALFYLRDFGEEDGDAGQGERIDTAEIARRAAAYEAKQRGEEGEPAYASGDEYLDRGYVAERNNFTMAYLLHAIASQQLGRSNEASDYYNRVLTLDPALRPLVERLRAGEYNTIVVVADGLGPRKIATGPGGALSRYRPIDALRAPARLYLNQQPRAELPMVTDVNQMALDHRWNNLEDVRVAKNVLGDLALAGGAIALLEGARREDATLAIVGAGVLAAGLFMKATARANTDHCDVFPQRLFLAALDVAEPGTDVAFELSGQPATSATLRNLEPPLGPQAAFHYVRAPADVDLNPPPPAPIDPNAAPPTTPTNDPTPHPEGSLP